MPLFSDISVNYVRILRTKYPRISMEDPTLPTTSGVVTSITLEKYTIDREDTDNVSEIALNSSGQIEIYYDNNEIFLDLTVPIKGDTDLGFPQGYNIISQVENNTVDFIDSDADLENCLYLYRIIYSSTEDGDVESSWVLAGTIPSGLGSDDVADSLEGTMARSGSRYRLGKSKSALYRPEDGGIIVEKGIAAIHATPRYRGPIELSKERARRTAIIGMGEYMDTLLDSMDSSISDIATGLTTLGNTLVTNMTQYSGD